MVLASGNNHLDMFEGRSMRPSTQNKFGFKLNAMHVSRRRRRFDQKLRGCRELLLTSDAVER